MMPLTVGVYFGEKENDAPVIKAYKDGEKIFVYYYPEPYCSVEESLEKVGLEKWEIEQVLKAIQIYSNFLEDFRYKVTRSIIEIPDSMHEELKKLAEMDNDTVTDVIIQAIRVYLKFREGAYTDKCIKKFYRELAEIEFDLLNLAEELRNEKLKRITNNLTNILNRMAVTFGISAGEGDSDG
jgi:predicted transcriptional regulator